jgi:hypothetical protein
MRYAAGAFNGEGANISQENSRAALLRFGCTASDD